MSLLLNNLLSSVSNTLNNSSNVSIETKKRINNAIRNYREKFMFIDQNKTKEDGELSSQYVYLFSFLFYLPIILAVVVPIILIWKVIPTGTNILLKLLYMFVGGFIGFYIGGFILFSIIFYCYNSGK